jgi:VCBS repeat-containing protein
VVRQTDVAGNVSADASAFVFTLDAHADAPTIGLTNDTGSPSGDKKTSDAGLSGTAEAGAAVSIVIDGGSAVDVTANDSGAWSYAPSGLTDGDHTVVVRQTDVAGNVSADASAFVFTLDVTDPTISGSDPDHLVDGSSFHTATSAISVDDGLGTGATLDTDWLADHGWVHGSGTSWTNSDSTYGKASLDTSSNALAFDDWLNGVAETSAVRALGQGQLHGVDVALQAVDEAGNTKPATITFNIDGTNDKPVATAFVDSTSDTALSYEEDLVTDHIIEYDYGDSVNVQPSAHPHNVYTDNGAALVYSTDSGTTNDYWIDGNVFKITTAGMTKISDAMGGSGSDELIFAYKVSDTLGSTVTNSLDLTINNA